MHWNSVSEFFAMGGYAFYVWGSFGLTALVAVVETWLIHKQRKELLQNMRSELLSEGSSS